MRRCVFDIETDDLLEKMTTVHCMVIRDLDTNDVREWYGRRDEIIEGYHALQQYDEVWGHNIVDFDLRALRKFLPDGGHVLPSRVRDTLLLSRLMYPEIGEWDYAKHYRDGMPGNLIGRHSLESWGWRLGERKVGLDVSFKEFSQDLLARCRQDTNVNKRIIDFFGAKIPEIAFGTENELVFVMKKMEEHGFAFNVAGAVELVGSLQAELAPLHEALTKWGGEWDEPLGGLFTPKVNSTKYGYVKGVPVQRYKHVVFNPKSRPHLVKRLKELEKWVPTDFTENGEVSLDATVLDKLTFSIAPQISKYFDVSKGLGTLSDGKEAWLKHERQGRIYGKINQLGAPTSRASHHHPNLAQVPSDPRFRALFTASPGRVLVGVDMSGIELRCLAHYMAAFDEGEYGHLVCEGDVHTENATAWGVDRPTAKTAIYAMIYGAGDEKMGIILGQDGKKAKSKLFRRFPALGLLIDDVRGMARARGGWLKGIDGRPLKIRSEHAALNTLLQTAGAVSSKVWINLTVREITARGCTISDQVNLCAWVHDETVWDATPDVSQYILDTAVAQIAEAGKVLRFKVPLTGKGHIGQTWKDIH